MPERLLVIGGGIIGLEMATVYDALGSKVTVVELMDQLIPGCDPDLVRPLQKRIEQRYDGIHLGTHVGELKPQKSGIEVDLGDAGARHSTAVLVAVGRRRMDARSMPARRHQRRRPRFHPRRRAAAHECRWIHAIGDIVGGPMLAHKASHEGSVAAEVIAGIPGAEFDPRAIPSVAYTDPEVAWMGLTETEAKASDIKYEKAMFPWSASGRALSIGRDDGFTKLLVEPDSHRVLGAGIVGANAGELIAETVHAIEMGADAEDLAATIHPHPTLSETVMFAAEMVQGTITTSCRSAPALARGGEPTDSAGLARPAPSTPARSRERHPGDRLGGAETMRAPELAAPAGCSGGAGIANSSAASTSRGSAAPVRSAGNTTGRDGSVGGRARASRTPRPRARREPRARPAWDRAPERRTPPPRARRGAALHLAPSGHDPKSGTDWVPCHNLSRHDLDLLRIRPRR